MQGVVLLGFLAPDHAPKTRKSACSLGISTGFTPPGSDPVMWNGANR